MTLISDKIMQEGQVTRMLQVISCTHEGCQNYNSVVKSQKQKPEDVIYNIARRRGWIINPKKGEALCPTHAKGEKMTTQLTKPREATTEDRRRIFREIDENYVAKSYIDGVTDKTIGEKLKMPWAWVAKVREENFGPEGEDKQAKFLKAEIERLSKKIDDIENDSLRLAERAEDMTKELTELKGRLDEYLRS